MTGAKIRSLLAAVLSTVFVGVAPTGPGAQTTPSHTEPYSQYGGEQYFRLSWDGAERRGHPVVRGYISNEWGITALRVRLRVESLDGTGQVTQTTIGYVFGDVLPGTRSSFEVRVPAAAPAYRVSVLSWEWMQTPEGPPRL